MILLHPAHRFSWRRSLPSPRPRFALAVVALALSLVVAPAFAQTEAVRGTAFGQQVDLLVSPLLGVDNLVASGPAPLVSGEGPPAFLEQAEVLDALVDGGLLDDVLQIANIDVTTNTTFPDGEAGVEATVTIEDLLLFLGPLLGIEASRIEVRATLTESAVGVEALATVTFADASILDGLGDLPLGDLPLGDILTPSDQVPPNTIVVDEPGMLVVLNAQEMTREAETTTFSVTGMLVEATDAEVPGLGTISGRIEIGTTLLSLDQLPLPIP